MIKQSTMTRTKTRLYHIDKDGVTHKVQLDSNGKFYLINSDIEVPINKTTVKRNIKSNNRGFSKVQKIKVRYRSYDDCWNESNLDGSFAYNGATEDF